jgi:hypothetical protein
MSDTASPPPNQAGAIGVDQAASSRQDDLLLARLNSAVAAANEAEAEHLSRSKRVGLLLLEAKKLHPAVKDFEAFLKRVDGLKLARAYDLMRLAGGRTTDEEIRKATRDRVKKHRTNKKTLPRPAPAPTPEPKLSVTSAPVTESAEISIDERKAQHAALDQSAEEYAEKPQDEYADWLDAQQKAAMESAHYLAEFTVACRTWLPKMVESDREKASALVRRLVDKLKNKPNAEAA